MMQQSYHFTGKKDQSNRFRLLSVCIVLLNAFIVGYWNLELNGTGKLMFQLLAIALTLNAVYMLYYKKSAVYAFPAYLLISVVWLAKTPYWYLGILLLLINIFHVVLERKSLVSITVHEIIVHAVFNKKYKWPQLGNVLLKDGLLTLDFNNNKILQVEPDFSLFSIDNYLLYEKEFNDFCKTQLAK